GDLDKLSYENYPTPQIAADEVLVEVKAISLNHLDLWVRQGLPNLKLNMPHILGSDAAGVVAEVGELVKNVNVGDKVLLAPAWGCGTCEACLSGNDNYCHGYKILGEGTQGVYAEYVKVPAENAFPIPGGLSFEGAAAIPLVYLTAWHMLVDRAKVQHGEDVLILAAGSGVGSAGIQIAKLYGARVIATASTDAKLQKAKELGADELINYNRADFLKEVKRLTNKKGVEIVFEHVGKSTWDKSIKVLTQGGRLVTCGATTGYGAVTDLRYVFFKELKILGNFMGRKAGLKQALKHFPERLKPVLDKTFPLRDAAKAHKRLLNREQFGKVILVP
ncbi:zinc-binding dehydrogenase, partial [candidate division KSB1 bacterium]|nr:zinc-binding dehydrogenase [candidate division KSB1 bacterium]NIR72321.1 zinc-binding dehydrogenase [candidate division KSB1 bacterium]NIS26713.1 zinc-binding dehydrogenase [candidate division KSB1 bacterium]NIT73459.1 zinc-binding dehydrogenase [candidate division KSB1 bacterium]NIU27328.1 zinc-binding dehydrogenase [candidate division KSB1 bacterium]